GLAQSDWWVSDAAAEWRFAEEDHEPNYDRFTIQREVRLTRIRFDGKAVVVSGAGHGFGRCIAEIFAQLGARVFGCDLSAAELAETAKTGGDTEVLDLTDRAAAAAWIAQIERQRAARSTCWSTMPAVSPDKRCARSKKCR